jgi:hypothetical protein
MNAGESNFIYRVYFCKRKKKDKKKKKPNKTPLNQKESQ